MKNLLMTIIVFSLFASGCKKKQYLIDRPTYGKTTVEINGRKWTEDIKVVRFDIENRLSFAAYKYQAIDDVLVVFETLSMENVLKNKEKQWIMPDTSTYRIIDPDSVYLYADFATSQDDGDVGCDYYRVLKSDSANNWIQITKEKDNYKEVWGTYSVTFLRHKGCAASPYTDTLRFRNGVFHFKFE